MDPEHLLVHIIRRVQVSLDLASPLRELLILGTACQESQCGRWLVQLGGGPALGPFQMEPATHDDLWTNYLAYKPALSQKVATLSLSNGSDAREMIGNFYYAAAMCCIHYLRVPQPIPDTLPGQAQYYKVYYNTIAGKATVQDYMNAWNTHIGLGKWI